MIYRNIAIVSAIFIVTFSLMIITNYFQVRGSTPLELEIMKTLKMRYEENVAQEFAHFPCNPLWYLLHLSDIWR